jgi:integrase/recombinase XerD
LRDWKRAIRKTAALESPEDHQWKRLDEAIGMFLQNHTHLESSTQRKYKNVLNHFGAFATREHVVAVSELAIDHLDSFRAERNLALTTSMKELQTLRQFFAFCRRRRWTTENPAKDIQIPKNVKPKDVEPYTPEQVRRIVAACAVIGKTEYERARARAMILLLRYTALSISDVATLARDRVRDGEILVRRKKTGGLVYLPVPEPLQLALDALPKPRGLEGNSIHFFWNEATMSRRCVVGTAERTLAAVFRRAEVVHAHTHRFRHTLATEMLGCGATFEEVADVLGNSARIVEKHYAKWSRKRQDRIRMLLHAVHSGTFLGQT